MFNDKYRLTQAVLEGRKTQTRRIAYNGEVPNLIKGYGYEGHICGSAAIFNGEYMIAKSRYNVYDVVAVAQSYQDVLGITHVEDLQLRDALIRSKGYTNKMFVRADPCRTASASPTFVSSVYKILAKRIVWLRVSWILRAE